MRKSASEKGTINRPVPARLGAVDVLATWAKELDGFLERLVGQANREKSLLVAQDARAAPKVRSLVLFKLVQVKERSAMGREIG